jgi:hypothetical protein
MENGERETGDVRILYRIPGIRHANTAGKEAPCGFATLMCGKAQPFRQVQNIIIEATPQPWRRVVDYSTSRKSIQKSLYLGRYSASVGNQMIVIVHDHIRKDQGVSFEISMVREKGLASFEN